MEGILSFLNGTCALAGFVIGWIIAYKRLRNDWLQSWLLLGTSITTMMLTGGILANLAAALPWNIYAHAVADSQTMPYAGVVVGIAAIVLLPLYAEAMWWLACLLRLIARLIPDPGHTR